MGKIIFTDCHSDNSRGNGFHIEGDVDVEFNKCTATNSGIDGFRFGPQVIPLMALVDLMRKQLAIDPTFAKDAAEFTHRLDEVQGALDNPATTKKSIKALLSTLKDKLFEKSGTIAGHAIYYLIEQAPNLIDSIQHMRAQ